MSRSFHRHIARRLQPARYRANQRGKKCPRGCSISSPVWYGILLYVPGITCQSDQKYIVNFDGQNTKVPYISDQTDTTILYHTYKSSYIGIVIPGKTPQYSYVYPALYRACIAVRTRCEKGAKWNIGTNNEQVALVFLIDVLLVKRNDSGLEIRDGRP